MQSIIYARRAGKKLHYDNNAVSQRIFSFYSTSELIVNVFFGK